MLSEFDDEGFLLDLDHWSSDVAQRIASQEGLNLDSRHWEIIHLVREYYTEFGLSPVMRTLVKFIRLKLGEDKGNSLYLNALFSGSPAKIVAKIAGLPKPTNCL